MAVKIMDIYYVLPLSSGRVGVSHSVPKPLLQSAQCAWICIIVVQCYAWTEYKFTCVCVCMCACMSVCVSVTLSVNSPTGQT